MFIFLDQKRHNESFRVPLKNDSGKASGFCHAKTLLNASILFWLLIFQDSRNFKKTLMELERFYNILIDVEDCEKKLAVLPTGTSLRTQVETDGKEGISNLGLQLVREDKLKLYMTVRKGKVLLIRALR